MRLIRVSGFILLVCSLVYLLVFQVQAIWAFTIDDMYITLRYAKHASQGLGLVWNPGESPLEGYSNFSFLMLAVAAFKLGINPVLMLKSAGVVSLYALTGVLFMLSRLWMPWRFAVIPCIWLLAYRGQMVWGVSGLETALYEALVVSVIYGVLRGRGLRTYPNMPADPRMAWFGFAGFMLACAGMTRPDACALMLLFVSVLAVECIGARRADLWRGLGVFSGVFALCFAPYFVWRLGYFGRLFPNPVYCKGLIDPFNLTLDKHYLGLIGPFLVFAAVALWRNRRRGLGYLIAPSVLYLVLCVGADPIVAFFDRLFLPAFALLLPLALLGVMQVFVDTWRVYAVAFLMLVAFIPMYSLNQYQHFAENPQQGEQLRERVLSWLDEHTARTDRVVLADSGLIPYKSALHFTDSYCLNNASMTQAPRKAMYTRFCQHALESKPHVIILTALVEHGVPQYTPGDACLLTQLSASSCYVPRVVMKSHEEAGTYYQYSIYTLGNETWCKIPPGI